MPNVPNLPGVPALASYAATVAALLIDDLVAPSPGVGQWGIFLDGENVIDADSIVDLELKQDNPISTYPVELGSFLSYDKVQLPREIRVRVSKGGAADDRASFFDSIDAVMNTTDLYTVVMPEKSYVGFNFVHQDFRRAGDSGLGLAMVDLWLEEVRSTATATLSNTASPTVAGQVGNGTTQPQAPPAAVGQNVANGTWGYL